MSDNKHVSYSSRRDLRNNKKKFSFSFGWFFSFFDLKNGKPLFAVTFLGIFFVTLVSLGGFLVVVNPKFDSSVVAHSVVQDVVPEILSDSQLPYSRNGIDIVDPDRKLGNLLALGGGDVLNVSATSGLLSMPLKNVSVASYSSGFGVRDNPTGPGQEDHTGLDFAAAVGTEVFAAAGGVVREMVSGNEGYGNRVVVEHAFDGDAFLLGQGESSGLVVRTTYSHLSGFAREAAHVDKVTGELIKSSLKVGALVDRGSLIAFVGSTGNSTGSHLHFEVELVDANGKSLGYKNPLFWLPGVDAKL